MGEITFWQRFGDFEYEYHIQSGHCTGWYRRHEPEATKRPEWNANTGETRYRR